MTRLYHQGAWWEPEDRGPGVGRVLSWLASTIALVIVVFAIADFFISWAQGHPILHVVGFAAAAVVWLIGRFCRSLSD
jgi:hypothetical protein